MFSIGISRSRCVDDGVVGSEEAEAQDNSCSNDDGEDQSGRDRGRCELYDPVSNMKKIVKLSSVLSYLAAEWGGNKLDESVGILITGADAAITSTAATCVSSRASAAAIVLRYSFRQMANHISQSCSHCVLCLVCNLVPPPRLSFRHEALIELDQSPR